MAWLVLLLCPPALWEMKEPDNCSIKMQLGSANDKGLPVSFQWLPPRNARLITVTSMLRELDFHFHSPPAFVDPST